MTEFLKNKLKKIPNKPGCYLWKNRNLEVIYIGKAKNLFKRTHQYFNKTSKDNKTSKLVSEIFDLDYFVVNNENESFILENNLIKKYKPKYNVLLREGGDQPYFVLTNEKHPRFLYVHDTKKYKGKYYGPFPSGTGNKYELFKSFTEIFPFRKCYYLGKKKCQYYDMKKCLGPCIHDIDPKIYEFWIKKLDDFFKGNDKEIIEYFKNQELKASQALDFETAQKNFNILKIINELQTHQNVQLLTQKNVDVIGYYVKNDLISIQIFSYINGKLLAKKEYITQFYQSIQEAIQSYLIQFYSETQNPPNKVYVNLDQNYLSGLNRFFKIRFFNPKSGKYSSILKNAALNAKLFYESNHLKFKSQFNRTIGAFEEFKKLLKIKNLNLINVFDMSNLFNDNRVGGMIALVKGEFTKELYRHYNIKDPKANSDIDYMYEVVFREYYKRIKEKKNLPNLIIVDGGYNQIIAAKKALAKINLELIIPVIGLSKNSRHQTNSIVINKDQKIELKKDSNLYFYLSNIQEEVHNYVIRFYRKKAINSKFKSFLNEIKGLGQVSANKLLEHYDNISNIAQASIEELSQYVKPEIASKIKECIKKYQK